MAEYKIDDIIGKYVELRDKKSAAKAKYDAYVKNIDDKLHRLEAYLLKQIDAQGVESFKSAHGTAYTQEVTRCSGSDWPAIWAYIKEHDRFDLLEKRISSKTAKEIQETTGDYPPGINVFTERKVVVRRA